MIGLFEDKLLNNLKVKKKSLQIFMIMTLMCFNSENLHKRLLGYWLTNFEFQKVIVLSNSQSEEEEEKEDTPTHRLEVNHCPEAIRTSFNWPSKQINTFFTCTTKRRWETPLWFFGSHCLKITKNVSKPHLTYP